MGRGPGVRATSASSIQVDFVYKGIRCRERLSLAPTEANKRYAKRLKATIDHEIATKVFDYAKHFPESPRARRFSGGGGIRLRDAMMAYLDSLAMELEPETIEEYRNDAERVSHGLGRDKLLSELTRRDIKTWIATLSISKKRIDNIMIPLRGMLDDAVENEELASNPLSGLKIRRVENIEEADEDDDVDPFSPAELDALAETELGYVWKFWAWTGPRSGEMIGLRWGDVFPTCVSIRIRRAIRVGRIKVPKTAAGKRSIILLPEAREVLLNMARGDDADPVFINPNTGRHWYEDRALARAFRKACDAAQIRYRYPYQLRHTFASWALSSGENPMWVAKQMGHKDVQMVLRVYGKYIPDLNPNAGQKMANFKAA